MSHKVLCAGACECACVAGNEAGVETVVICLRNVDCRCSPLFQWVLRLLGLFFAEKGLLSEVCYRANNYRKLWVSRGEK